MPYLSIFNALLPLCMGALVSMWFSPLVAQDRAWLGVRVKEGIDADVRSGTSVGPKILEVEANSPAAVAGIKAGDVIVSMDGQLIFDGPELVEFIQQKRPGSTVLVRVRRDGSTWEINVLLGKRPSHASPSAKEYRVVGVASDDVLHLRASAGAASPIVTDIPHDATRLVSTGRTAKVGDDTWMEIVFEGSRGWVNAEYIMQSRSNDDQPVAREAPPAKPPTGRPSGTNMQKF